MDDEALSRRLTEAVRAVDGVTGVYAPRTVTAAAEVVAATLTLHEPDVLVDVDRHGGTVQVVTGIAVDGGRPAAETVRAVGERLRDVLDAGTTPSADLIRVTVRLVDDAADTSVDRAADGGAPEPV